MYNLIACVNNIGLLGQENDLYINSSKDLHYFSQITRGHPRLRPSTKENIIVMGYNTWLSLPTKPLKGRHSIVLTKRHTIEGVQTMSSLEDVFLSYYKERLDTYGELFIIGGATCV